MVAVGHKLRDSTAWSYWKWLYLKQSQKQLHVGVEVYVGIDPS